MVLTRASERRVWGARAFCPLWPGVLPASVAPTHSVLACSIDSWEAVVPWLLRQQAPASLVPMLTRKREIRQVQRRYPIGAELIGPNQTHFRVWGPKAQDVDVVLEESAKKDAGRTFHPLEREDGGYFSGAANAGAGALYRFRVNKAEHFHPDPASRFQPHGPHGSSCVVDPTQFKWTDSKWRGVQMKAEIIYEMHVGTFTKEGTWRAASEQLAELARIGITVVEMMPIADFP